LLDNLTAATGKRGIALPASVGSTKAEVGTVIEQAHVRRKVFIAKERVRLSHAHHCVIVCPGVVEISHGSNNVVVAGQVIDVSFDGMNFLGGVAGAPDRSAFVCGRRVSAGFARDTVCAAPHADFVHAYRVTFLGRASGGTTYSSWSRDLDGPIVTRPSAPPDPLADRADRVETKPHAGGRPFRLHARFGSAAYDLAEGDAPADGPLAGWRLVYCNLRAAVLYNGREWSLLTPKKPPGPPRR
jgi:hypothetical protein